MLRFDVSRIPPGQLLAAGLSAAVAPEPTTRTATRREPLLLVGGAAFGLALAVVATLHMSTRDREMRLQRAIAQAEQDSIVLAGNVAAAVALRREDSLYTAHLAVVATLDAGRFTWARIIADLGASVPAGVWLTKVSEAQGGRAPVILVEGAALGVEPVTAFLRRLQEAPHFGTPRFVGADPAPSTQSTVFRLEVPFQPDLARHPTPAGGVPMGPGLPTAGALAPTDASLR